MDLELLIIGAGVLLGILGLLGPLLWWGLAVWLGLRVAQKVQDGGGLGAFPGGGMASGLDPSFVSLLQQLEQLIQDAQAQANSGIHQGAGINLKGLPPHVQAQFNAKMLQAQRDMRAMDHMRKEQADLRMATMLGQASSAGIDVSSWRSQR